jgi:hypothetical protein
VAVSLPPPDEEISGDPGEEVGDELHAIPSL